MPTEIQMLALVDKLEETLVPVEPSSIFVDDLGQRLLVAARQRHVQLARSDRRRILIGAAALGSMVGVIAYIARYRARAQHATPG